MNKTLTFKIVIYLVFWFTFPITIVNATPPTPANLKAESIISHYISFSWSSSSISGISYEVKQVDSTNNEQIFYSSNEFYLDTALKPGTNYRYRVRSVDNSGLKSNWSDEIILATKGLNQHIPNQTFTSLNTNEALILGTYAETCRGFDGSRSIDDPDRIICTRNIINFSGFNYDPINHQILMVGAGRVSFFSDAVVSFNFDSLTWQELYRPTPCGWLTVNNFDEERRAWLDGPQGPYPRPVSRHSYEGGLFVTVNGQNRMYYMRNGGLRGYGGSHANNCVEDISQELELGNGKIAYYDFSSNNWAYTDMGYTFECCWMRHPSHEYDPVSKKIISISNSGMWIADPENETRGKVRGFPWIDTFGNPVTSLHTGTELIHHPPTDSFFLFNRENGQHIVYELELDRNDFSKSTLTKIQTTGQTPPAHFTNTDGPGFTWDSSNDIIGGAVTQGVFYAFDPNAKSWSSKTIDVLNRSDYDINLNQAYYAIAYNPIDNIYLFLTTPSSISRWKSHIVAYRYQKDDDSLSTELTVISSTGGSVTSQPHGIDCGTQCTHSYAKGTSVTLSAHPESGFVFSSWNISGCSNSSNTCNVHLDTDIQVIATFSPSILPKSELTVSNIGNGVITSQPQGIDCGTDCIEEYNSGSTITLTAEPNVGWIFTGWNSPECNNTSTFCTIVLTSNIHLTATFSQIANTAEIIVDNKDSNTLSTGNWSISGGANPYAGESLFSGFDGTFRWLPTITESGTYEVYAWWTYFSSRSTNVPYRINHNSGLSEVFVNQRDSTLGGKWFLLGIFPFETGASNFIELSSENGQSSADAVRLVKIGNNPPSEKSELSIHVNGQGAVTSNPQGIDCGTDCIETYNNDTTITLTAEPNAGWIFTGWNYPECNNTSTLCTIVLTSNIQITATFSQTTNTTEIIVDNKDSNTLSIGNWSVSGGANPYAGESLFSSGGGTFRWIPTINVPGTYKVYAWWTYFSSRSANVPYRINHSSGLNKVFVNQRDSAIGGQWNLLGTYTFESGANNYIEVSSENGQTSSDAIRLLKN